MMKKIILLLFIGVFALSSCSKEDVKKTSCFQDSYNGTYSGTGKINGVSVPGIMTVRLTKLSCESCKIQSGGETVTITSLEESTDGQFVGKDSNGDTARIDVTGTNLEVDTEEIEFSGTKN
jgi:hypothetical protein